MKGTLASLAILFLFAAITAKAEIVSASVPLSPANEVPPVTGLNATGGFQVTVNVTRDAQGAIIAGTIRFLGSITFPGAVTVVGLHIHEGPVNDNGMVRFDSGITAMDCTSTNKSRARTASSSLIQD